MKGLFAEGLKRYLLISVPRNTAVDPPGAVASIEVGTHTARLLMADATGDKTLFLPLVRERRTIRLAQGFGTDDSGIIKADARRRAVDAVRFFARIVRQAGGEIVRAVATGVTRTAVNRHDFIQGVFEETGVRVRPISGEEEAAYTEKGVLHALGHLNAPYVIFDLGGGTTEFIIRKDRLEEYSTLASLPLGALLIKEAFFSEDPPQADVLKESSRRVDHILLKGLPASVGCDVPPVLIGSGGTATTIAAMLRGICVGDIRPESMNGLILERRAIEELHDRIISIPVAERRRLTGLDSGRADVIHAGTLAVLRILHHFEALRLTVCLSDILEGLLIDYMMYGDDHEH